MSCINNTNQTNQINQKVIKMTQANEPRTEEDNKMTDQHQLARAEAVLKNLEEVIDDITEGNVKGSWGRKIIGLAYHHPKIPGGLHLDDYFVETFSALGYFFMNYNSSERKDIASVEVMISKLGEGAGNLLMALRSQAQRFREYVPRSQEFTAKMEEVWYPTFRPICDFLQQFVCLRYERNFSAYFVDMETPITKETITYALRKLKLPE